MINFFYPKEYHRHEDYCTWVRDEWFGVRFNFACYLHDRQYRHEVKVRHWRLTTDFLFCFWIIREFWRIDKRKILLGIIVGIIYSLGCMIGARKGWVK